MRHLIVLITCVTASKACSCAVFSSLKEAFCAQDFVSHLKVKAKNDTNWNSDDLQSIMYTVEHIYVYRKPTNMNQLSNQIASASSSAACGIELTTGKEYLIGGCIEENGALCGDLCGLVQEWSTVTTADKSALETYECWRLIPLDDFLHRN